MSDARKEDEAWFAALRAEMAGGGLAALLHDMLAMDLGDWHPRSGRPQTAALTDQKVASLKGLNRVWFECLRSGELPVGEHDGADIWLPATAFVKHADRAWRPKEAFSTTALAALRAGIRFAATRRRHTDTTSRSMSSGATNVSCAKRSRASRPSDPSSPSATASTLASTTITISPNVIDRGSERHAAAATCGDAVEHLIQRGLTRVGYQTAPKVLL